MRTQPAQIENQIDQRGHNHSPDCARDWKRGLPGRGQLTSQQFSFDFEPDQEKKHGHQTVVDPIVQAQRKLVRNDPERQRYFPKMVVSCGQRRIGNGERGKTESQQDETAKCLCAEKALKDRQRDFFQPCWHVSSLG